MEYRHERPAGDGEPLQPIDQIQAALKRIDAEFERITGRRLPSRTGQQGGDMSAPHLLRADGKPGWPPGAGAGAGR